MSADRTDVRTKFTDNCHGENEENYVLQQMKIKNVLLPNDKLGVTANATD